MDQIVRVPFIIPSLYRIYLLYIILYLYMDNGFGIGQLVGYVLL